MIFTRSTAKKRPGHACFPTPQATNCSSVSAAATATGFKSNIVLLVRIADGDDGDFGLSMESYEAMRSALKPGPDLDGINRSMVKEVVKPFDQLQPAKGESKRLGMYAWLRDAITTATTRSVYGPMNPYDDPELVDAFWKFESDLMSILIGFLLALTARKPVAARTKVAKAFEKYYKAGGFEQASAYAKKRYQAEIDNNVPLEDIARYEVGGSIAVLVNTAPVAFWILLLFHLHPGLLDDIRKEVDACTSIVAGDGCTIRTLDITNLKESCPLLLSSYQEVLRYCSMGTSVREKGAMLQMPSCIIHQDGSLWGDDVNEYSPRRFLPGRNKNRPRDACFRAFGGGKTLCPGRHFATNEILAIVATFVARFDMKPTGGEWKLPTGLNTNAAAATIMQPDNDVEVEIKTRQGFENTKWVINLQLSENIFALVTEDTGESV
ncbi:putative cytochrome P450 [Xylaria sp. FL1042]|nr:putative cytochrome P450 [Xylaria sp. FL1042]